MKMEDKAETRIVWIWCHSRGGEDVAQVAFSFPNKTNQGDDTLTFSVNVPMSAILSVERFCAVLLEERLNLTGSEDPREIYEEAELGKLLRVLTNVHPKIWGSMIRAAKIQSANAILAARIHSWMCRDPRGNDGTPPWDAA